MKIFKINILLIIVITIISGCFGNSQNVVKQNDNDKINVGTIAILPIENKDGDIKAAQLFRSKLFEEIYFKGYSKIPLEEIDNKLESLYAASDRGKTKAVSPETLKDAFGADAGMYCTLTENKKSKVFYEYVKISATCELRSTDNGEALWKAQSESIERNFDFTNKRLEKKVSEGLDSVMDDVVNEIIETLPEGPNLRI
ncbi:MAG: DUF799 family lipoprotein [Syntrophaceae bacterium]|nr:DUF799 family lipoprotein [Syntrophaceae bacterium]